MRNEILLWLTRNLPARAIDLDGQHYIERYHCFRIGKLTVMLHRYLGSDGDRNVHCHPWRWSLGIPLVGGYLEERVMGFCTQVGWVSALIKITPWRWNYIPATRFHRVASIESGTWTLFITYDRFKSWTFAKREAGRVILNQPYDVASVVGWQERAMRGYEFRVSRGTA